MKKLTKIFILGALLLFAATKSYAQNMSDMRLNEILVTNTDGYIDSYGSRSGWIELFNTSYGTVDIGGCYITDDPQNLKKYTIPKGDVLTSVKPRQHVIFYADNDPGKGTFHINFTLDNAKEVLFVSSDGKTIIDRIQIPALPANKSYGRVIDGEGSHRAVPFAKRSYNINKNEEEIGTDGGWDVLEKVTPSTNNVTLGGAERSLELLETDPFGIVMAMTAMSVVFCALILLYAIFKNQGKYFIRKAKMNEMKAKGKTATKVDDSEATSAEIYAAISMAFHLYNADSEAHDFENTILTIDKVSRNYSPWSSKIYTLRETPQLKK